MKRSIFATFGDTHANSKVGLMNPEVELEQEVPILLDDGSRDTMVERYSPSPTLPQQYVWSDFTEDIGALIALADGDPVDILHGGDLGQGSKHPDELVSTRLADALQIAYSNLQYVMEAREQGDLNLRNFWIAKGTGSHSEGEGSVESIVASRLRDKYDFPVKVAYHYLLDIDGYTVDASHHGPGPGIRNWLRGNILQLYVLSLMMDELDAGNRPPDMVLRYHFHQFVRRWSTKVLASGTSETLGVICPSYCFTNDYARKVARSPARVTIGQLAFELLDGKLYRAHEFRRTYDLRTKVVVRADEPAESLPDLPDPPEPSEI